ncbi:hypothetical protein P7C70_g7774, partial [Phenoliferia sp. Uapishka_3]
MPNTTGKNQWSDKETPSDEVLLERFRQYDIECLDFPKQVLRFRTDCDWTIHISTLKRHRIRLGLPGRRLQFQAVPQEVSKAIVEEYLDTHPKEAERFGPRHLRELIAKTGSQIPREFIRSIMLQRSEESFDDFDRRWPLHKKMKRFTLTSAGLHDAHHADGHEKLCDPCRLPIYGMREKQTGKILWLQIHPNVRKTLPVALMHLDLINQLGGMPVCTVLDRGSETSEVGVLTSILRTTSAPHLDPIVIPPLVYVQSKRNTIIESFWRWLREQWGDDIKKLICEGLSQGLCDLNNPTHRTIYHWVIVPLVQASLDVYVEDYNNHTIRHQADKLLDSGMTPNHAYSTATTRGYFNCLIPVSQANIDTYRKDIEDEIAADEQNGGLDQLWFWTKRQNKLLKKVWASIGGGTLELDTAFDSIHKIIRRVQSMQDEADVLLKYGVGGLGRGHNEDADYVGPRDEGAYVPLD